jgi:uncharacterized protein (TIGR03790 family)
MRSLFLLLILGNFGFALEPKEIVLITNSNEPDSKRVAEHYCKARQVPVQNIVALDLPKSEDISRKDYDAKLADPLRKLLTEKPQIKVLLTIYGVPLRVSSKELSEGERKEVKLLDEGLKESQMGIDLIQKKLKEPEANKEQLTVELTAMQKRRDTLNNRKRAVVQPESVAAVDSELMLVNQKGYPLDRWQVNFLHWQVPAEVREKEPKPIMTCRLDGPTPELVMQMIDDSIAVEKEGLQGKVYVDARGFKFNAKSDNGYGYAGYDESMREMAELLKPSKKLEVILDDKPELFKEGSCPETALYCGWYSHANFIDCCKFQKGAIAWHLASSEAVTLRKAKSKVWCPNLLQKGVVVTLGPVAEPYTVGFPKPAEFFGFIATGKFPLVECYAKTVHFTSWMTTLVGDPLYTPFKTNPQIDERTITSSPKQAKFLLSEKK